MATGGDRCLDTGGDFFMATDLGAGWCVRLSKADAHASCEVAADVIAVSSPVEAASECPR